MKKRLTAPSSECANRILTATQVAMMMPSGIRPPCSGSPVYFKLQIIPHPPLVNNLIKLINFEPCMIYTKII